MLNYELTVISDYNSFWLDVVPRALREGLTWQHLKAVKPSDDEDKLCCGLELRTVRVSRLVQLGFLTFHHTLTRHISRRQSSMVEKFGK